MNKTVYIITEHSQEIRFANMDWEKFINNPSNYLQDISGVDFVDAGGEFTLKEEAERYITEHPIYITRFPDYFIIQWLELIKVTFDEDIDEVSYDLVSTSKLDLSNAPIKSAWR